MRGIALTFHVSRNTLKKMLKKSKRTTNGQEKFAAC